MLLSRSIQAKSAQIYDRLLQRGLSLPSDLAFNASTLPWVEHKLLRPRYRQAIEAHKSQLPAAPTGLAARILRDLEWRGVAVTSLKALGLENTESFWRAATDLAQTLQQQSELPAYQNIHTLTASAEQLMHHPEIFHWGAHPTLLAIAEQYFKLPVAYDALSFYHSVADGRMVGPRKWHRDKEDWKMLKVCVYLNAVDQQGGPFECVTPQTNAEILNVSQQGGYQVFTPQLLQQKLKRTLQSEDYDSYVGGSGTVIFVDTATYYHRGCPPQTQNRSAVFFGYFSRSPRHPFFGGRSPLSGKQLHQLAKTLPSTAQAAVHWRKSLSGMGRLIPKNYLKV